MGASAMREGLRRSIGRVGLAAVPLVVSAALLAAGAKFAIDDSAARDVAAAWAAVTPSAHRAETTATRAPPAVSSSHNERALPARRDPESYRAFQALLSSHPRS